MKHGGEDRRPWTKPQPLPHYDPHTVHQSLELALLLNTPPSPTLPCPEGYLVVTECYVPCRAAGCLQPHVAEHPGGP